MWKRIGATLALVAITAIPAAGQIFTDMTNHPYRRASERLAAKGIVKRLPDGRFAPDEPLTRLDIAVFLAQSIGVPPSGLRPPDFRDVDQIPPADRAAVVAASVMGAVSATKIEVRKGPVLYTLTTDKAVYAPAEPVLLRFTIANVGPGIDTEMLTDDRGRPRIKLTSKDGLRADVQADIYTQTKTPQGTARTLVARVRVVETRSDDSVLEVIEFGPATMKPGLKVSFHQDVWFEYSTSQLHDFIIRDSERNEMARWSLNRPFFEVQRPIPIGANQTLRFESAWKQLDQNDRPLASGRYDLVAVHTTKENPTSLTIGFQRGIVLPYPDNTFRPKQPVTRSDLAVFMVRAVGLESEAARRAGDRVPVADAADIAAEARGSVIVAMDKKLVLPFSDNTFRPGRTATRGEAIFALNAMMEMLDRYDFTTAALREVRAGPPPIVVIEDASKQIRSLRVSTISAIYRNNQVTLLLNLRPGDQLKMLKPSDAGEIMYIEATGR